MCKIWIGWFLDLGGISYNIPGPISKDFVSFVMFDVVQRGA
jgi:hypothetical protein